MRRWTRGTTSPVLINGSREIPRALQEARLDLEFMSIDDGPSIGGKVIVPRRSCNFLAAGIVNAEEVGKYMREYTRAYSTIHRSVPTGSLPCKDRFPRFPVSAACPVSCRSIERGSRSRNIMFRQTSAWIAIANFVGSIRNFHIWIHLNAELWRVLFRNVGNSISPKKASFSVCFFFSFKRLSIKETERNFD